MNAASGDAIQRLGQALPEFQSEIDAHFALYDELLPHVLYGDLTRFVVAAHQRGDDESVERALTFLESELRDGDAATQNLVCVSFVENVELWAPAAQRFIDRWPPRLRSEAARQRDGRGSP